jgi:HlyD family secretion protein
MMRNKRFAMMMFLSFVGIVGVVVWGIVPNVRHKYFFQFVPVQRGDIRKVVTSTGMVQPRSRVEVGTQVSGTVDQVYVTFNDVVQKGQRLAELDKKLIQSALDEADATRLGAEARLRFSTAEFHQNQELFQKGLISELELLKSKATFYSDSSALLMARANVTRAKTNLEYAEIVSPIRGTLIEKNVEAGQTFAANFNTPTLFVIAEDLSKLEIHVTVDESDISSIFTDQKIEFSVLAYPDSVFTGEVSQIRLCPRAIQNVVNYIVVATADNKHGILLPGMTATVDFIIEQKKDVLMVAKSALAFNPPKKMADRFHRRMQEMVESLPDSLRQDMMPPRPPGKAGGPPNSFGGPGQSGPPGEREAGSPRKEEEMPFPPPGMGESQAEFQQPPDQQSPPGAIPENEMPENVGQVWYLDENGDLAMEPVETGASDDDNVELVRYRYLKPGMQVISNLLEPGKTGKTATQMNQLISGGGQQGMGTPPPPPSGP